MWFFRSKKEKKDSRIYVDSNGDVPVERVSVFRKITRPSVGIALLGGLLLLATAYSILPAIPPFPGSEFLKVLCHEIGFALIVACTIWIAFEVFTHAETDEEWSKRIEQISRNVFFGVFRRNLPKAFINEASLLVLEQRLVRTGLNVTYTIVDACYPARGGGDESYIRLHAVARFKVLNVANDVTEYPLGISLPNPMIEEMKKASKVTRVVTRIGGVEKIYPLEEANRQLQADLADDTKFQIGVPIDRILLNPNQDVEVTIHYIMAKEDEDTEIFQTLYPADSLILTVMDRGPTKREVRARAIHMSELQNDTPAEADGTYNFKLDRYLFPRQGFAIWWKKVPGLPPPEPLQLLGPRGVK